VGVISHEAHGTTIATNGTTIISKETLATTGSTVTLQASITPTVTFNSSNSSITLTISGANFIANNSYTISGASCSDEPTSSTTSLTFTGCDVIAGDTYGILVANQTTGFSVSVPQSSSSIVLSYSSNVTGDTSASATIAEVQQQLTVTPANAATAFIDPSSESTFTYGTSSATNSVVISNNAYGNSAWSNTISPPYTISFLFTNIPSSVSAVSATDSGSNASVQVNPSGTEATVTFSLASTSAPFQKASSDTLYFSFTNSGNIQPGTIYISSILGPNSYQYFSGSQNFLTFTLGGTQIYIPDALVSDSNAINYSYLTISMPSSASIASISVLNTGVNCSVSSISLTHTGTTGVYYMSLSQLVQACPGISSVAWQAGVPLVINISGSNVAPNTVTADAYAVFLGHLKRIPVVVLSNGTGLNAFSY
jgi:hypothetical protein